MGDIWEDEKCRKYIRERPMLFPDQVLKHPDSFSKTALTRAAKAVLKTGMVELYDIANVIIMGKNHKMPEIVNFGLIVENSECKTYQETPGTVERSCFHFACEQFDLKAHQESQLVTSLAAIRGIPIPDDSECRWPDEPWDPSLEAYMAKLRWLKANKRALLNTK